MGEALPRRRLNVAALEPLAISMRRRIAEAIATGFGSGLAPIAPATAGSAAALLLFWVLPIRGDSPWWILLVLIGLTLGAWVSHAVQSEAEPDPRRVVVDEFAGMWVTAAFLDKTAWWMLAAFVTFRVLDVAKPWPIRRFERLPGGLGIMADDVAAGILGAGILNGIRLVFFT